MSGCYVGTQPVQVTTQRIATQRVYVCTALHECRAPRMCYQAPMQLQEPLRAALSNPAHQSFMQAYSR
jgi:hypothetical protein